MLRCFLWCVVDFIWFFIIFMWWRWLCFILILISTLIFIFIFTFILLTICWDLLSLLLFWFLFWILFWFVCILWLFEWTRILLLIIFMILYERYNLLIAILLSVSTSFGQSIPGYFIIGVILQVLYMHSGCLRFPLRLLITMFFILLFDIDHFVWRFQRCQIINICVLHLCSEGITIADRLW